MQFHMAHSMERYKKTIVLGDGAPGIWSLADEHFPDAKKIVDFYHASEHISSVGKTLGNSPGFHIDNWVSEQTEELNVGDVEKLIAGLSALVSTAAPTARKQTSGPKNATSTRRVSASCWNSGVSGSCPRWVYPLSPAGLVNIFLRQAKFCLDKEAHLTSSWSEKTCRP
jgi:hypothetical protein